MKIRLLNDGGYAGFEGVTFPVEVDGTPWRGKGFDVSAQELARIGVGAETPRYFSLTYGECEVAE